MYFYIFLLQIHGNQCGILVFAQNVKANIMILLFASSYIPICKSTVFSLKSHKKLLHSVLGMLLFTDARVSFIPLISHPSIVLVLY